MLKKIIAIKNVGRFRNSSASGNTQLAKHTFIVGANGYGKTTICSVLRSLQSGETSHVLGRKTLGVNDPVTVDLLFDTGAVRFDGTAWPAPRPGIAIFDGVFVADNVHSGEVVDIAHKRNLYRVIVGEDGVKLAAEDTALATQSRAKTTEISTAAKAIQPHLPPGMKLEAFIALTPDEGIDAKIDEQTRLHQAALQAATIEKTDALATFAIAELPANLPTLLAQTIDGISKDAEDQLSAHIAKHAMGAAGENWISEGIGYTDDTCAFCGQDVKGLPLIGAFRAIFSEQYDALKTEIAETIQKVLDGFGPTAVAKLQTVAAQNGRAGEFWKQYCDFNSDALNLPANFNRAMEQLCEAAVALLDRKAIAPLEPLATNKAFNVALANYKNFEVMQASINEAIGHVNGLIAEKKKTSANADVKGAEAELAKRKATKTRHLVAVAALCDAHT
jgi:wobble nucleotide-excising tRNase